jgi:cbb3-type cytochrome oxidase subunit 3
VWAILPDGCTADDPADCDETRGGLFLINRTTTWEQQGLYELSLFAEEPLGLSGNGLFGYDAVTLGWPGQSVPSVDSAVMAGIATKDFYMGGLPLNPWSVNFTSITQSTPSLMTQLKNQSKIPSLTYGYTAGFEKHSPPTWGSLTLGGYDRSRRVANEVNFTMGSDISYDLLVGIQSIDSGSTRLLSDPIFAFINSGVGPIWLPTTVCEAFEAAFGLVWDTDAELYLVSDTLHTQLQSSNPSVRFTVGPRATGDNVVIEMPYAAFDLDAQAPFAPNASRYFPLKRAANSTQYTLGRTFLQSAYLTVNFEYFNFSIAQALYPDSGEPLQLVSLPAFGADLGSDESSGLSSGAIAGIAVGAAAIIIIIIGAIVWFVLKKKRQARAELEAKAAPLPLHEAGDTSAGADVREKTTQLDSEQIHETDGRVIGHELEDGNKPPIKPQQEPVELPVNEPGAWEAPSVEGTPYATPMATPGTSPFNQPAFNRPAVDR